jgi:hypothetical protein
MQIKHLTQDLQCLAAVIASFNYVVSILLYNVILMAEKDHSDFIGDILLKY